MIYNHAQMLKQSEKERVTENGAPVSCCMDKHFHWRVPRWSGNP